MSLTHGLAGASPATVATLRQPPARIRVSKTPSGGGSTYLTCHRRECKEPSALSFKQALAGASPAAATIFSFLPLRSTTAVRRFHTPRDASATLAGATTHLQGVAQLSSAPAPGAGGRECESHRPDHSFGSQAYQAMQPALTRQNTGQYRGGPPFRPSGETADAADLNPAASRRGGATPLSATNSSSVG